MSNIIDFNKYRKKIKNNVKVVVEPTTETVNPPTRKGWYFGSLDESDTATILRAIGYFFGLIFGLLMIPCGFSTWIVRGLLFSGFCWSLSYLLVLRKA
jgi:hypothetical protein